MSILHGIDVSYAQFTFQYGSTQICLMRLENIRRMRFTFQYGSTQIKMISEKIMNYNRFTFQYGSTQILRVLFFVLVVFHLHSNMDLLK